MITLTLKRVAVDTMGTHGMLYCGATLLCYTEELPWDANHQDTSCVPFGSYLCTLHNSVDHPHTWQLNDVPDRTNILLHNGNTMKDTKGCILVGMTKTPQGVGQSVSALEMLRGFLPDEFMLEIVAVNGMTLSISAARPQFNS